MDCHSDERWPIKGRKTPPDARGLVLTPLWGLGDTCTTPAGKGLVVALILGYGGEMTYRVRVWIGDEDGSQPVEMELYAEEITE